MDYIYPRFNEHYELQLEQKKHLFFSLFTSQQSIWYRNYIFYEQTLITVYINFLSCRFRTLQYWLKGFKTSTYMSLFLPYRGVGGWSRGSVLFVRPPKSRKWVSQTQKWVSQNSLLSVTNSNMGQALFHQSSSKFIAWPPFLHLSKVLPITISQNTPFPT